MLFDSKLTNETEIKVRSIRNSVLKEYLCLKKPHLLHKLAKNCFPTPRPLSKINFIDVDAISTDGSHSIQAEPNPQHDALDENHTSTHAQECPPSSLHHPNCASNFQTSSENITINQSYIENLLSVHGLTQDHHYTSFLSSDKKFKKIGAYFANFEQIVFDNKMFCDYCEAAKHSDFISKLKVVLLLILGEWSPLTRYQKCDHVAAIILMVAAQLSNLPKKCVLDSFKQFEDENFGCMKIRHLRKAKLYHSIQQIIKSTHA